MAAAKRRFRNQKLGRNAELLFEAWANAGPFVANKQSEDYGIDYVCRELRAVGSSGTTEETTGVSVSVQVRSTSSKDRPRISLDREDVETALRQEGPYCIVGINATERTVHFRFLDLETAATWAQFLQSNRASLSMRLDSMSTGMDAFVADLRHVSRPAFRAKLAHAITLHAIRSEIPESNLELSSGPAGEWALIRTPSLGAIFSPRTPDERESLARTLFSPEPFDDKFREALEHFTVQPSLHRVWDLTDGEVYFAGEAERRAELTLEDGEKHVTSEFIVRSAADERAYIGRSGLVIRISRARQTASGQMAHQIGFELRREGASDLASSGQVDFLRALVKGARLQLVAGHPMPVEAFGLEQVGQAITAVSDTYGALGFPMDGILLADLRDRTFTMNVGFLQAMLASHVPRFPIPAFVLGLEEGESVDESNWRPCSYSVPFAAALKSRRIVLWLRGEGEGYVSGGVLRGFRLGPPTSVLAGEVTFDLRGDGIASAYFCREWPPFPLTMDPATDKFRRQSDLPIEGEFLFHQAD